MLHIGVMSELRHIYAKDPLCMKRLIYLCVVFIACPRGDAGCLSREHVLRIPSVS